MDTAGERQQFRKRLVDLSDVELTQWSFLCGLASRIETELLVFHALFSPPGSQESEPAPDTQLAGIQLLITQELKKRRSAPTTKLHIEGEENNHANTNGNKN